MFRQTLHSARPAAAGVLRAATSSYIEASSHIEGASHVGAASHTGALSCAGAASRAGGLAAVALGGTARAAASVAADGARG
jgi:hypothetical protein